jgi:ketosteroid isomerase-like protein
MEISTFLGHKAEDTPNVRLVKDLYMAMNGGDRIAFSRILSDDPTWNVCPGNPEGGTYHGMDGVFGTFYRKVLKNFHSFKGEPEVFIDGGDVVTALGFYSFKVRKDGPVRRVRFSHTWKISTDSCVEGVWQVCDSFEMREFLKADKLGD